MAMAVSPEEVPDVAERMALALKHGACTVCPHPWEPGHGTGCMCGAPLARSASAGAWPSFALTWMGDTTYPVGRGVTDAAAVGWRCPGCGRCWAPQVLACHVCPEAPSPAPGPQSGAGCRCCPEET